MDNKKNKNIKYSSKIISATLLAPALTNVVAHASVTDYSIVNERTKLESSVNIAESFVNHLDLMDNEDKKILSKDLLEPALNAALIILNNEESSLEDIVKINSILNKTLLFIENTPTVKKSELELSSRLYNIKKFISEAEESNDENKYPVAAIEILSQKVDYCEELLKDRLLISEELMNVGTMTIDESVKEFKEVALLEDVDKSELNNIILVAEVFQNDSIIIGVKKGEYHKLDYEEFAAVLTEARKIAEKDFVTDAESVAKMVQDLQDLMDEFPSRQITEDNILQDKIDEVDAFLIDIIFGEDLGNYSEEPMEMLNFYLEEAKENVNSDDVEGHRLYEMYENLLNKFEELKSTKILEVDKTELKALIEDAERLYASITKGDKPGQYYEKDYNEFRAEIDKAIVVANNKQANLALVTNTHKELQDFKNNFSSKEITTDDINKTELDGVLSEARNLHNSNIMNAGFDKGQYLISELELLYDEIQKADAVFSEQMVSQKEVDDAKDELSKSVERFKNSLITADKSILKKSLEDVSQILNDTVVGSQSGQYPAEAKERLQLVYDSAMNAYKTVHFSSNQGEIDTAVSNLELEVDIYLKSIIVDLNLLSTTISEAQSLYDSNLSNIGVDMGNCLEESLNALSNAITEANSIYEKEFVTQEEVNEAQSKLANDIINFNDNIINVDKSELKENIRIAQALVDDTTVGTNPGQYPEEQREVLYNTLDYARITYLTQHKDESLIASASQTLSIAIQGYLDSVIKEDEKEDDDNNGGSNQGGANPNVDYLSLNNSIDRAKNILDNNPNIDYFENEITEIKVALTNAENIKKVADVTQSEVDNIAKELDDKVNAFSQAETTHIQDVRKRLKDLIDESKGLIQEYYNNFSSIGSSNIISGSLSQLETAIADSESLILLNTTIITDYDSSYNSLYKLKIEFDLLINGSSTGNDGTNNDNNNNNNNNNNTDVDNGAISEEEALLVEEYKEKITDLLLQIRVALSTTEVGFKANNCSENNKRATMYMYQIVEKDLNECERIEETRALYNKANATLLDFTNKSISITESGIVNGKNLTGIVKNLTKVPAGEVISYDEEFIPNAGMPIDVKAWMTVLGSSFIGLGAFFKRKK